MLKTLLTFIQIQTEKNEYSRVSFFVNSSNELYRELNKKGLSKFSIKLELTVLLSVIVITCSCFNTFTLAQGKTILQGQVKQSDGAPLRNSAVMLIQYNPASKTYSVVDSAYTDADGKYKFQDGQQYFILARPDESLGNELPTYYGNSLFSQNASPLSINFGDAVTADFSTQKKIPGNTGIGSIGGSIQTRSVAVPFAKTTVLLADKDKNPVAVASANASGNFRFTNLPYGDYFVWVDFAGVDNTIAETINLNNLNPVKDNLHFHIYDGSLNWVENNYSSIKDALANKESVYTFNLNSLQHEVADKSLVISSDGSKALSPQIGEFTNLESLSIEINSINSLPADIGKLGKLTYFSASLNRLSSLPAEMSNLKNLKTLNLGKNNFSAIPEIVTKLPALESLNIESNPITTLPFNISDMKNLKELNLSNCFSITALPVQIGDLSNLETLILSNCTKIKALPKELKNLKTLKVLDITGTKLSAKAFQKTVPGCEVRVK